MAPAAPTHERLYTAISSEPDASLAALTTDLDVIGQGKQQTPQAIAVRSEWNVKASELCGKAENPIRKITDSLKPDPASKKAIISLGQGDPTVYGHLKAPASVNEGIKMAMESGKANGYVHSCGLPNTRRAVAEHYRSLFGEVPDASSSVIMTCGCNQALELVFAALCSPGGNVLVPRPGYPLYETFLTDLGAEARYYDLLPNRNWEIDLDQVAQLRDDNTAALVVCNPGNPTGGVFSREHLQQVLSTAEHLRLPVISDEVYEGITFGAAKFHHLASLPSSVPIVTCSSISKRYLVPGWRMGWIIFKDPAGILSKGKIPEAIGKLLQSQVQPSSLVQAALPHILENTTPDFFTEYVGQLSAAADLCFERVRQIHGLSCPSKPQGSMFIMVKIDFAAFKGLDSDVKWCAQLLKEESVVMIPGAAFKWPGWARCVFALPWLKLAEAWERTEAFCKRHAAQ